MKRLDMSAILAKWVLTILFIAGYAKAQQSSSGAVFDYNLWIAKGEL